MNRSSRVYIINNITLPADASDKEAFSVAEKRLASSGASLGGKVKYSIYRRSTDARKKGDIRFVYSVLAEGVELSVPKHALEKGGISIFEQSKPRFILGKEKIKGRVVVVGSGPCGMFCALTLAELGFPVTVIEQGGSVGERKRAHEEFCRTRKLDTRTNIQFGAGGAGTFSDGKLVTRVNDPLCGYVMDKLVEFGAPEEIRYLAKPHIGTDVLSVVVDTLLKKIEALGGLVLYHTEMLDIMSDNGVVRGVKTNNGDISASAVVLAVGHSARDAYAMLMKRGLKIEAKPFSVGMRIEHKASDIDKALYGDMAGHPALGHAEYNLFHNTKVRGVYTFCMCPGGVVVPAASEEGGVVVNGMSYHSRNAENSNSAVLCSIFREDYGGTPMGAIEFQRQIEEAAYRAAGSDYTAPCITVGDFISGKCEKNPDYVKPSYMDGAVRLCDPAKYLPGFVLENIKGGLRSFDKKISGFASANAVLTGPETRTSAPLRILRDAESGLAIGYENLYPAGEGAGYAGGITSAAIDGIKVAMKITSIYQP